jgi:hypothetical protein
MVGPPFQSPSARRKFPIRGVRPSHQSRAIAQTDGPHFEDVQNASKG